MVNETVVLSFTEAIKSAFDQRIDNSCNIYVSFIWQFCPTTPLYKHLNRTCNGSDKHCPFCYS